MTQIPDGEIKTVFIVVDSRWIWYSSKIDYLQINWFGIMTEH